MAQKRCEVYLISQLIKNLNTQFKTTIKVDKLLNKDWNYLEINKEEKKTLYKELTPNIKTGKAMSKRRASCFNWMKQTWSIANQNRFL